ncbi:hypothetical protein XENOCAPTIV_029041 [Xenoophorus captivus]|uniref:Uncharacterized protein n=1 Tax=Xenoophorus captivus TaxID=1517983 RepID=A0ABV0S4J4_9TELE
MAFRGCLEVGLFQEPRFYSGPNSSGCRVAPLILFSSSRAGDAKQINQLEELCHSRKRNMDLPASPSGIMLSVATVARPLFIMSVSTSAVVVTVATTPIILLVVVLPAVAVLLMTPRAVLVPVALASPAAGHLGWMMPVVIAVLLP